MNNYIISIGGTGSKSVESIIHACAAGIVPGDRLKIIFVDPDTANGSLERTQLTLQQYINCSQNLEIGDIDLFKSKIEPYVPNIWSPFGQTAQPRLDSFFQYNILKLRNPSITALFDVLYSKSERETPLDKGFRGHPSIGAAVMAKTVKLGESEPWKTFFNEVQVDGQTGEGARIFLVGSIFGGTGASGFPTIARIIRNGIKTSNNIKLGGALILPYFSFIPDDNEELRVNAKNFLVTTKVALDYYFVNEASRVFDSVYMFGNESPTDVRFCIGGKEQKNNPHFIELYAALSAIDFFGNAQDGRGYFEIARRSGNRLDWGDLPDGNNGTIIKQKIGQLTRFAFSYLSIYEQMLDDIHRVGSSYRAPWFVNFFDRKEDTDIRDNRLQLSINQLKDYCVNFLEWIANIQASAEGEKNLIKCNAFIEKSERDIKLLHPADFTREDFRNLVLPEGKETSKPINRLWESMCDTEVNDPEVKGIGRFVNALYNQCFC